MKRLNGILSIGALIVWVFAAGCSKSKESANAPAGGASGGVQTEPSGPVTMRLKWQPGKQYDHEVTFTQTSKMSEPGVAQTVDQTMNMVQRYAIIALSATTNGGMEVELKFTGQQVNGTFNGRTVIDFDSARPESQDGKNPAAPLFRKMTGLRAKCFLDASGKLVKIEGLEDVLKQMSAGDPHAAALMKGLLSEETIKQWVERGEGLPDKPVKVGDSWPVTMESKNAQMGIMKTEMTYTFKGWQEHDGHKCALLDFTGTITSHPPASSTNAPQITMDNGKITGKTWYDPDQGMVLETTSEQSLTLKTAAGGKGLSSQMQQNVTTRLLKVSDAPK
ncbi:MAG TPA: DUF6263 family protein [Verrucomicrobiae bacterium]|nr:DUF6263 family protein [Verrucomicrobiae bacterium]